VTRDSDTTFKVKRPGSPGRFGCLFKSLLNLYGRQCPILCRVGRQLYYTISYRLERAAACQPWGSGVVWRPPAYNLFRTNMES